MRRKPDGVEDDIDGGCADDEQTQPPARLHQVVAPGGDGLDTAQNRKQHRLCGQRDPQPCGGRRRYPVQHQHCDHPCRDDK
jgi:hypothetical protein